MLHGWVNRGVPGAAARLVVLLFALLAVLPARVSAAPQVKFSTLPLAFEPNRGQAPEPIEFLSRAGAYTLNLDRSGISLVVPSKQPVAASGVAAAGSRPDPVRIRFLGASDATSIHGVDERPSRTNYLIGSDPTRWRTDIPNFGRVAYRDLYAGIDLVFYGNQRQLEYDFIVAPGADPHRIRLAIDGQRSERVRIDESGRLVIALAEGEIFFNAPVTYQEIDGTRQAVESRFVLAHTSDETAILTFEVGVYDSQRALVIDPTLVYSGYYFGGADDEIAHAIAIDSQGSAYIAGETRVGGNDRIQAVVIAKLNPAGDHLAYQTVLSGTQGCVVPEAVAEGIAVDTTGSAYVTGWVCASDFPVPGPPAGDDDAFVLKLNPAGNAMTYARRIGGSGIDRPKAIALDAAGNAYIGGGTNSTNFPTTAGSWQPGRVEAFLPQDGFVAKLGPDGATQWATYFSGNRSDGVSGIAVDAQNPANVYVSGNTNSTNFVTTPGSFQPQIAAPERGDSDAFVVKLSAAGAPVYSTLFGGSNGETAGDYIRIAVGPTGRAYIGGGTNSTDMPLPPSPAMPFNSVATGVFNGGFGKSAFLAVFNETGSALLYSTYLAHGDVRGIAVRSDGVAYLTGVTAVKDFPVQEAIQGADCALNNMLDICGTGAFVSWIKPAGLSHADLLFSTYLGGNNADVGEGIAVDVMGNAYVVGTTRSTNFPEAGFPTQDNNNGGSDIFIAKIAPAAMATPTFTPTARATNTPTPRPTITNTPRATITRTQTPTDTPEPTPTEEDTPTPEPTNTRTRTRTRTRTPTPSSTFTFTSTATPTTNLCGNGMMDEGEECDEGAENSDVLPNTCRTLCKLPSCGDGVKDDKPPNDESCDDGNKEEDDGCPTDCKLEIQLRPFLIIGRGLCSNEPVEIQVTEGGNGNHVVTADPDIEYEWVKPGFPSTIVDVALRRFVALVTSVMGASAPPDVRTAQFDILKDPEHNRAHVVFFAGQAGFGVNVLRAVRRKPDGTVTASNIALVLNGVQLDGENALEIAPVSGANLASNFVTRALGQEIEDPPLVLFTGGILCSGRDAGLAKTGFIQVKSITFNFFGGRIKDVDLFDAVQKIVGYLPAVGGPLAVLGEAASLGRAYIASQFLDFEVSSKAAMDAEEQSGRTQTEDDVIRVKDEIDTAPPFFKGFVTAKAPGLSAVQATLDLEDLCMGKSDDEVLVIVGPRLEKTEIRNEVGKFESPLAVPLNGTRTPHAVALLNGLPATGPVTLSFDPVGLTGDQATKFRKLLARLIPGSEEALNEIGGTVHVTVPFGEMLDPTAGLYRGGNTFFSIAFTYNPFAGSVNVTDLRFQLAVPNLPQLLPDMVAPATWEATLPAPPAMPVVRIDSPSALTTGLRIGEGEIKVNVCLPLIDSSNEMIRMAKLPVIVSGNTLYVAGFKYDDRNGNGASDNDPELNGWTIELVDAFGQVIETTTTGPRGQYFFRVDKSRFPDDTTTFGVRERQRRDWTATKPKFGEQYDLPLSKDTAFIPFGNFKDITLTGVKFHDHDGDGVRSPGDEGLIGWTIEYTDGLGHTQRTVTKPRDLEDGKPDGWYEFTVPYYDFLGGEPTVREIPQNHWSPTFPDSGGPRPIGKIGAPLSSGDTVVVNFGNFFDMRVEGTKFEDLNGDGMRDAGEPGLPGWTIQFVDTFGNVRSTVTDSDGDYFFRVPITAFKGKGQAKFREVQKPGWVQTFPRGDGTQDFPDGPQTALKSNGRYTINFGNRRVATKTPTPDTPTPKPTEDEPDGTPTETPATETPTITGTETETETPTPTATRTPANILTGVKYEDLNGNGRRDVDEPRLKDWVIFLDDNLDDVLNNEVSGEGVCDSHAEEECKFTDVAGVYAFSVGAGFYRVREVQQPGWARTSANPPDVYINDGGGLVPLSNRPHPRGIAGPMSFQFLDFGNFRLGNVPGVKFEDRDGDGRQDDAEPGLPGWIIYDDANENGRLDAGERSVATGAGGAYLFRGLPAGRHVLREVNRCGYQQTLPTGTGAYEIDASSSDDIGPKNFGNRPPTALPGDSNRDGRVSVADLLATQAGLRGGRQNSLMDANQDGVIDANDISAAQTNLFACSGLVALVAPLPTLTPTPAPPTPAVTATSTTVRTSTSTPTRASSPTFTATPPATSTATRTPTGPLPTPTVTPTGNTPTRTRTLTSTPTATATATQSTASRCREPQSPLAIPDGSDEGLEDVLTLSESTLINDLNVRVKITHGFVGDLIVTLTHVATGTQIQLVDQPGEVGGPFGCDGDDIDALFSDEASASAASTCGASPPALGGELRPIEALSEFDGQTLTGQWRLTIVDVAEGDPGALVRWCLEPNSDGVPAATPTRTPTGQAPMPTPTGPGLSQCDQPNMAIPDDEPAGVSRDLVVAGGAQVADLNVRLEIDHTWVGDLLVRLTHVDTGHVATLLDRPGDALSPGGCGEDDVDCVLDDEAATAAEDQCSEAPAIGGTQRPSTAFSVFDGESAAGTWRLTVSDRAPDDTGTLVRWCLGVNRTP